MGGNDQKEGPDFFVKMKEDFLANKQNQGEDFFKWRDFIEDKGAVSVNENTIRMNFSQPNYVNPLLVVKQPQP